MHLPISKKLELLRKKELLTQQKLADLAGIDVKHYGKIERGETKPTIEMLRKLCEVFNISIAEFFLITNDIRNLSIIRTMIDGFVKQITIHLNRDSIEPECESSIWYSGYIGSVNLDEYEVKLYARGEIKGKLYQKGVLTAEFHGLTVANELTKYIKNEEELKQYIVFSSFDETILKEKKGNAFFLEESNWLTISIIDNEKNEVLIQEECIDEDNIFKILNNHDHIWEWIREASSHNA